MHLLYLQALVLFGCALGNKLPHSIDTVIAADAENCTSQTKQRALYSEYLFSPTIGDRLPLDMGVDHIWDNITDLKKYGQNGIFAAQPFGLKNGLQGYFGSQVCGKNQCGGLLLSVWDWKNQSMGAAEKCVGALPNETWCQHKHVFPVNRYATASSANINCHRHCLDCGLHPGWHNTTGTQCSINMTNISNGDIITFRFFRVSQNTSFETNIKGIGFLKLYGSIWKLIANYTNGMGYKKSFVVGELFFEDSFEGISRIGSFHEHIGCTPCKAFTETESRHGPWINEGTGMRRYPTNITFTPPTNTQCKLYNVQVNIPNSTVKFETG